MSLASPCLDICKFDRKADLCVGCFRTAAEIRQWRKFTDHKRHQILAERTRREAKLLARRGHRDKE
ncbi:MULTISPECIES: DUF1289 domain-containing protein [Mesorhizobium]|uniref:DUF1289 domain-containing protein n=1 Tax=Mesorhizobium TaxID=68287 RepID=UPI000FCA2EAD|nr:MULTISPECIES: DUF1289 domain-containing protein [Mesorhizobium]RUY21129.1 DUF1289 domain-containing protein [Mesorhizobium sp. M7A.F.Ca.US.001.04.2.1]RUY35416.1 DUF1289 domain-containing protein [Mesorhizobium sp. M7A.F.Ca.US.001.04.1.1]